MYGRVRVVDVVIVVSFGPGSVSYAITVCAPKPSFQLTIPSSSGGLPGPISDRISFDVRARVVGIDCLADNLAEDHRYHLVR